MRNGDTSAKVTLYCGSLRIMTYYLIKNGIVLQSVVDGKEVTSLACIQKKIDGVGVCMIPLDEDNTDYQEYLEWAKTNTSRRTADEDTLTWDDIRSTRDGDIKRDRLDNDNWSNCRPSSVGCI